MKGVTFDSWHSYSDLGMILSAKTIGSPSAKTSFIDIPGSDGKLDYTEYFGEPRYNNRTLSFEFTLIGTDQLGRYADIQNKLHGKKMNIFLDEDTGFYYNGRLDVGDFSCDRGIGKLKITADCSPWKYKSQATTVSKTITTSGTVTLSNLRKSVVPKITTDAAVTLAWTGASASLGAGSDQVIPELVLPAGDTVLTVTGSANISFSYREASL